MRFVAFVACCTALLIPARADALRQPVAVTRPDGQLVIEVRGADVAVVDTRADDPGRSVAGIGSVARVTPAFTDGSGVSYQQEVALVEGVASASPHHGLGIAHLRASADGSTVTITVI